MKKGWKILAILLLLTNLMSLLFVGWMFKVGTEEINKEYDCAYDVCGNYDADAYIYNPIYSICECYNDHKVVHTQRMK